MVTYPEGLKFVGAWRSLVARTVRVGEVAGSNPAAPISQGLTRGAGMHRLSTYSTYGRETRRSASTILVK
jgi:hypothetical protein